MYFFFQDLSYKDRHWHEFCFKCCECGKSLVDQAFAPKNDQIFCSDCHDNKFAARCDGCGEPFRGGKSCINIAHLYIQCTFFVYIYIYICLKIKPNSVRIRF